MKRLLVVDDALFMRRLIGGVARDAGWEVVGEAGDGSEAVALYPELKPDLVTMDLVMPNMGGLEALRLIRESDGRGEFATGILYIEPAKHDFTTLLNLVDEPLATLPLERVRPGREVLESIDFTGIKSNGFAFQIEMNDAAKRLGFSITEVPIVFEDRRYGYSKMDWSIVREGLVLVARLFFRGAPHAGARDRDVSATAIPAAAPSSGDAP